MPQLIPAPFLKEDFTKSPMFLSDADATFVLRLVLAGGTFCYLPPNKTHQPQNKTKPKPKVLLSRRHLNKLGHFKMCPQKRNFTKHETRGSRFLLGNHPKDRMLPDWSRPVTLPRSIIRRRTFQKFASRMLPKSNRCLHARQPPP